MNLEKVRAGMWLLSAVLLTGGFYVGWSIHAHTGATMLVLSAFFALLPFATHRDKWDDTR